jgi:peptidylprolyl isomerase
MAAAKRGDTVSIHYTGTLDDGSVFDSSEGSEPITFTIGSGEVIPGFEEAVTGMSIGDKKTTVIDAANAYGDHHDELIMKVDRSQVPPGTEIAIGDVLQVGLDDGQTATVIVTDLDPTTVTLDANHPLAGKALTFALELVSIS